MLAFYDTFPAEQRSSMSEDLSKGHWLELPWLSGRIHDLGLQHGIPTPAHTAAYRSLILYANGRQA
jgi:2-dehydropantoate 2-reductase